MIRKSEVSLLIFLFVFLFIVNYSFLDNSIENFIYGGNSVLIERVVDGDTLQPIEGENIRLLGINTPERGDLFYEEAKEFLEDLVLNKTVRLEFLGEKTDKYGRTLAYVFIDGKNVNLEIVENGFGNYYFYNGRDKYSEDLEFAWNNCLEKEVNLCEKSKNVCSSCITIERSEIINSCSFNCNIDGWSIKEEGRDKIIFEDFLNQKEKREFNLDLDSDEGSLFLRDDQGKLVGWEVF